TFLAENYQRPLVMIIDDYLLEDNDGFRDELWRQVQSRVRVAIEEVSKLLHQLREENSDFVLENSFATLVNSLASRESLLNHLVSLPPPNSDQEIDALTEVNDAYKRLISQLSRATRELNKYVKMASDVQEASAAPST